MTHKSYFTNSCGLRIDRNPSGLRPLFRKCQTATEYLIILAVVIVIALIVIGVLGGIPGIGGGVGLNANDAELQTAKIGVMNHALSNESLKIVIRNNLVDSVSITALTIEGTICSATSLPAILKSGQQKTIICTNINSSNIGARYEYDLVINYADVSKSADYVLDGLELVGIVSGSVSSVASEIDYTTFDSIVIDDANGLMWQAGDSQNNPTYVGTCSDGSDGCLAWGAGLGIKTGETCDNRGAQSSYPACEYCETLALCNNGSFDVAGNCNGDYSGVLFDDWRLPSYINGSGEDYDIYEDNLVGYFKQDSFTDQTSYNYYWTGTSHALSPFPAYYVDLNGGYMNLDYKVYTNDSRARCVRDH